MVKKPLKDKNTKNAYTTEIRPNLNTLGNDSLSEDQLDLLCLRLHFELRQLKKKYR